MRSMWFAVGSVGVCLAALIGAVTFLVGSVGYGLFGGTVRDYLNVEKFDRNVWIDPERTRAHDSRRLAMIDDLLSKHDLRGQSRSEVVALLGEAEHPANEGTSELVYWLGQYESGIGPTMAFLVVRLDGDGIVDDVRIAYD